MAATGNSGDAHIGVGGQGSKMIVDLGAKKVPMMVTFAPGETKAHISRGTLEAMTGIKVNPQLRPTSLEIGSTINPNKSPFALTVKQGTTDIATTGRHFMVSATESTTAGHCTIGAAHGVAPPGGFFARTEPIVHTFADLTGMHGDDHHSASITRNENGDSVFAAMKCVAEWPNSIGASMSDAMHGCVSADGPTGSDARIAVPLVDSEATGRGQFGSLLQRRHKMTGNLSSLIGSHHITDPMPAPAGGVPVPFVVMPKANAEAAVTKLCENLAPGPFNDGLTFELHGNAEHHENPVSFDVTLNREPAIAAEASLKPGQPLTYGHVNTALKRPATQAIVALPANPEAAPKAIAAMMFSDNVKLTASKAAPANGASKVLPVQASIEVHASEGGSGGDLAA